MLPQAAVVGLATYAMGRPELAPWAIITLCLWQFQETIRRVFMARLRHRVAALGDSISYLGQAVIIWACASHWGLSVNGALMIMAVTSVAAGLVQIIQHGVRWIGLAEIRHLAGVHWELGRWILMTNFVGVFLIQAYPWALAFFHGAAAAAEFQAVANILGITHPVDFGIGSLIYPAVAKMKSARGEKEAAKAGLGYGLQGGLLLLPFYFIMVCWPGWVLQLFYGADSHYLNLAGILRLFVICYSLGYVTNFMVVILNSLAGFLYSYIQKPFPSPFPSRPIQIGNIYFGNHDLGALGVTLLVLAGLYVFFRFTTLGLAMRAAAQNPVSSRLCGIRVGWMLAIGWGLAALVGAVAGMMVAPIVFLDPNMMAGILIYAFASATLGGFTSPGGAVLGGLIVGVIENLVGTYVRFIGTELKLTVAQAMIIVVLLVRPTGLFGSAVVRRV